MTTKRMHVAVNCTDLEASLEFYRAFFGVNQPRSRELRQV